jgi:hypothetical protein
MPHFTLSADEHAALVRLLRSTIEADRYPMSPRIRQLRAILDKLDPSEPVAQPYPAPKPPGEPSHALRRRRR